MVSKQEKTQVIEQLSTLILNSNLYTQLSTSPTSTRMQEKTREKEAPRTIDTIVANFTGTTDELKASIRTNQKQGIYTAIVFYQDAKSAHVRMVQNEAARLDKSFKLYTPQQIRTILTLREKEKEILKDYVQRNLTYLNSINSTKLMTGTVEKMSDVNLDYTHIKPSEQPFRFVQNKVAIDYKLPEIVQQIYSQANFRFQKITNNGPDPDYRAYLRQVEI